MASLGVKPTFSGRQFSIEAHIFDFDRDIYGEPMTMEFVDWIREEKSFSNAQALAEQIGRDAQEARRILDQGLSEACNSPDEEKSGTLS